MKNELFERMPIYQAVLLLGLPTMAGMILTVLYHMADMIFVGMTGSADQLVAFTLLAPVSMITMSIGTVFGIGGASCISRQLGTKRLFDATHTCSFCIYSTLLLAVLVTTIGQLFLPSLLEALGVTESMNALAIPYGRLLVWGTIPASLTFIMNQLIRARGLAREAMNGMVISAIVNLITGPFFILFLGMGVHGSAISALTADLVSVLYYVRAISKDDILSLKMKDVSINRRVIAEILSIGLPTCLTHFILSGCGILMNRLLVQYGDHVIAAFGVASRVLMIPNMISMGLAQGAQPLIGYSYAAKNYSRMKAAIRTSCLIGTVLCLIFALLVYFHSGTFIHIFTNDPDVVWLGMIILSIMLFAIPISALEAVLLITFQAIGNSSIILFLSIGKQVFLYIPLMFLFHHYLGLIGLILLYPTKEYLSTLLAFLCYLYAMRRGGSCSSVPRRLRRSI